MIQDRVALNLLKGHLASMVVEANLELVKDALAADGR
jgi:hypothetical protein